MKRLRRALAFMISALIICSFLSACGDPYKKLRKEDAQIRSAMENADFGHGDKFAVYDHVTQLYSFSAQKIPDELRAKKPEEIGAFIHYDEDGPDGSSPVSMRLIFAFDRDLDFNFMVLPTEVDVICTPPKEKQVAYREPGLSEARDTWSMLRRWYEEMKPVLEFLNRCEVDTHYLEPGGGRKMICLNRDSGAYDLRFVPYDGLPRGNEDVGYIFAYSITKVDVTGEYKDAGEVSGKAELMKWELLDAVTGEVLESGEFGGEAPFILFPGERSGFDNEISYAEIQDMIEKLWRDSGRRWY